MADRTAAIQQRTHVAPFRHRPPFRQIWRVNTPDVVEFPPAVAYGRVYVSSFRGHFYALDAASGRVVWKKRRGTARPPRRCSRTTSSISPISLPLPCARHAPGARGFVVAWDAATGRELWRYDAAAVETSPLVVGKLLYFGSWDGTFYALSARTGKVRWTFHASASITSSARVRLRDGVRRVRRRPRVRPRRADGKAALAGGVVLALRPARVLLRDSDGRLRARLHRQCRRNALRVRREVGPAPLGAERRHVHLHRGRGLAPDDLRRHLGRILLGFRRRDRRSALALHDATGGISGAPTVMAGLVYYSTFGKFTNSHQRRVEDGPYRTYALDARTGTPVWQFPDGSTRRWSPTGIASISPGARPCTAWSRARPVDG